MPIIVKPISAMLTTDKDMFGKSDPYTICIIGNEKQQTKAHSGGGKNPQWMDTLCFNSMDQFMKVQVYDKDTFSDDMIGQGTLNLTQLYNNPNRTENEYVDLIYHGKPAGRVLISIEYQGQPMGGNYGNQNSGWGNQNSGWGGNNNQGGWGQQQQWGNQPPNNQWGNQPNNQWGNQPNNQWGNQPNNQWGNQPPNNQWGNQPNNNNNSGWGNNGSGWGNNNSGW